MSELTRIELKSAITGICQKFSNSADQLNDLDSQLGDGDLGTTLAAISAALQPKIDGLSDDIGENFVEIANTIAATSGSSFSAITMFGLLKVASSTKGETSIPWSEVPDLIDLAIVEMSARGGAQIGDKTLLDGLVLVSQSIREKNDSDDCSTVAKRAVAAALLLFRDKPSKIGRARTAGIRSIGIDDPGMFALSLAINAL